MISALNEAIIWRDEKIAALEAQVDECEREIDHWKVQAHSYKPAWDQMKSENLTLEAENAQLRGQVHRLTVVKDGLWEESRKKFIQITNLEAQVAALSKPPSDKEAQQVKIDYINGCNGARTKKWPNEKPQ